MLIIKIKKSAFLFGLILFWFANSGNTLLQSKVDNQFNALKHIDESLRVQSMNFPFIKNEGQADSRISFYSSTSDGMAFITKSGDLLYSINYVSNGGRSNDSNSNAKGTLRLQFKGGKANPIGFSKYNPRISYYLGNDATRWRSYLPTYNSVQLGEVWPGIEVSLRSKQARVGKYFEVQPGGDISSIKIQVAYAQDLRVHSDGHLVVYTDNGPVKISEPFAYQFKNGKKVFVPVRYQVDKLTYGFKVSGYDPTFTVYIDPLILVSGNTKLTSR